MDFAGWLLPVQYRDAIAMSHQHTRTHASLFDVGHMLQTHVTGRDAGEFLESLTTADLQALGQGCAGLTVFTNQNGGILDDLIITKDQPDKFFVVSNAGRRNEDMQLMLDRQVRYFHPLENFSLVTNFQLNGIFQSEMKAQGKQVNIEFLDPLEQGLIALQGPSAVTALQSLVDIDLTKLKFMMSVETVIDQKPVRISRCGYTGEDGFEISIPGKDAKSISELILSKPNVKLAGLGARDSLR